MTKREILKTIRKRVGWTQRELANFFKVKQRDISYWESGKREIPKAIAKKSRELFELRTDTLCSILTGKQMNKKSTKKTTKKENGTNSPEKLFTAQPRGAFRRKKNDESPVLNKTRNILSRENIPKKSSDSELVAFSPILPKKHENKPPAVEIKIPKEDTRERQLLDGLIAYKRKHGNRYPTTQDFKDGKIKTYSLAEIKEHFVSLRKAKRIATEIRKLESKNKQKSDRQKNTNSRCSLCGKWIVHIEKHFTDMRLWMNTILGTGKKKNYRDTVMEIRDRILSPERCFCGGSGKVDSSLRTTLSMRFEALLEAGGETREEAIVDCKQSIFGDGRRGYITDQQCYYCKKIKGVEEMTLHDSNSICEICAKPLFPPVKPTNTIYVGYGDEGSITEKEK